MGLSRLYYSCLVILLFLFCLVGVCGVGCCFCSGCG